MKVHLVLLFQGDFKVIRKNGSTVLTLHGKGFLFVNENKIYDGEWKEGKKHGNGVFFYNKYFVQVSMLPTSYSLDYLYKSCTSSFFCTYSSTF